MTNIIYLDNNGTTAMKTEVKNTISLDIRGNPSSTGIYGQHASNIFNSCKKEIEKYFNISESNYQIVFTSGASESNNTIINSSVNTCTHGKKPIIITTSYEHNTSLQCINNLTNLNKCSVISLGPNTRGLIEPSSLETVLNDLKSKNILHLVCLVSIMHINNEIGSKNAINELGIICKKYNVPFHSDVVQSIKFETPNLNFIDAISVSFHKFGGPKSCGLLIYNKNVFKKFMPLICGTQQNEIRGGTENINLIYGGTLALVLNNVDRKFKNIRLDIIRNEMLKILSSYFNTYYHQDIDLDKNIDLTQPCAIVFGPKSIKWRAPNTIYFAISGGKKYTLSSDKVIDTLNNKNIVISKGSTCNSKKTKQSAALLSINVKQCLTKRSFRISLGDENLLYPSNSINAMHDICKTILFVLHNNNNNKHE